MATVTGDVTLDGQPLAEGNIRFEPSNGDDPTAGDKIHDGKFKLDVAVGKAKVRITASKVIGQEPVYPGSNSMMRDKVVELIPRKYNAETTLELDVQKNAPLAKFDLLSKP
ncbi:hypothetical protein [Anatilimnocola floriformis]|uniref:hypothetical protein n=1 Tax=Anatilimnocola floriformis TaxID=2948575 RepID=UPI0020C4ABAF|nr:hypothetical protein [Anatilimnocola floriformis]